MTREISAERRGIDRAEFRRGLVAIMPLWLGAAPFAVAYAVLARETGLSAVETIALSLFVMAGAAQLAFVDLVEENAAWIAILATVLLLNLRHILYGLSLNDVLPESTRPPRPVLAHFVTDEAYGVTIRDYLDGRGSPAFLFGAGIGLGGCFVLSTVLGVTLGRFLPDADRIGLEFVFPLTFLSLLLPLIRKRTDLLVAVIGGAAALALSRVTTGGITILVATIAAAGAGAAVHGRTDAG